MDLSGNTMANDVSWSFTTPSNNDPTQEPLLYQSNLQYIGAFRVPDGQFGPTSIRHLTTAAVVLSRTTPANNSLFVTGHTSGQEIAEISIPSSIVNSSNINSLATATVLQPFTSVLRPHPKPPVGTRHARRVDRKTTANDRAAFVYYDPRDPPSVPTSGSTR